MKDRFELIVGIEVHAELDTKSKIFCSCKTDFAAPPNTQCCPVCMGLPGSLPVLNKKVVSHALTAALALNCEIEKKTFLDRKNYFYPDLPKSYQISQKAFPIAKGGYVDILFGKDSKRIGITEIHIEEDAGKLIHKDGETLIDCNRCGIPLIEIVSEPDIRSSDEAVAYLKALRSILLYSGVSKCRMNEGNLRFDVNLSVRKIGEENFGTRTEMKNLNSFAFVKKAIEYEYKRQVGEILSGGKIIQETRRFDESSGMTYSMREKENAADYRYFKEPDIPPFEIKDETLSQLYANLPRMPRERILDYIKNFGLSLSDAETLTSEKALSDYFEEAAKSSFFPKTTANILISELLSLEGENFSAKIPAEYLSSLSNLFASGRINSATEKKLLRRIFISPENPEKIAENESLWQINSKDELLSLLSSAANENPKIVSDIRNGKSAAKQALIGKVMAKSKGLANPLILDKVFQEFFER